MSSLVQRIALPALVVSVLLCASSALSAQAGYTGERAVSLSLFGGGSLAQTDYNSRDTGFVVGGDLTRHMRHFEAALDVRFTGVQGAQVNQSTFTGGLKASRHFGRLRPYADGGIGAGYLNFVHPSRNPDGTYYAKDNSAIIDFGGGADYRLTRSFSAKVDFQYQFWKLGAESSYLTPSILSVGLTNEIPFSKFIPRH